MRPPDRATEAEQSLARPPLARDIVLVLLISLATTLPFLNKAFHIDDVLYLAVADQILKTPWDPYGETVDRQILWDSIDGTPDTLFQTDFNPPLWKYALAGVFLIAGRQEWQLHLLSAITVCIAALGIYAASTRFTRRPLWCVLMIIPSPFFMPGINLMLEAPVLAFTSWGIYFLWRSWESNRAIDAFIAGLLVGLAILTKYTIVLFIPLWTLGALMKRRPKSLLFLLPALGILALWSVHNLNYYGRLHMTSHGVVFKPDLWIGRAFTVLRIIGAVSLFAPFWVGGLRSKSARGLPLALALLFVSLAVGYFDLQQAQTWFKDHHAKMTAGLEPFYIIFTTLGAWTLLLLLTDRILAPSLPLADNERQWELWVLALVAFNIVSVPFNAVRHLLILFVAMTWLTASVCDRSQFRRWPNYLAALSVLLAALLAWGDYAYANGYREFVRSVVRDARFRHSGVWFSATWGFKYYAEQEGAIAYYPGIQRAEIGGPLPGDVFFHPQLLNWAPVMVTVQGATIADLQFLPSQTPLRPIMPGVNYYGVGTELLPWGSLSVLGPNGFQFAPLDAVAIYNILDSAPTPSTR